ncbi:MAG: hypothetical protein ABR973_15215 [Candidatus Acidiferrales bacterium]|jgi:hypothetical protein
MYHLLFSFCEWLQNTDWALNIAGSTWAYPYVQMIHFSGLSLWVGTNLALDLNLLGVGRKRMTPAELSGALFAWNWIGLGIAVTGGFMLFATAATSFIVNPAFRFKLGVFFPIALILHIVVQSKARTWGQTTTTPGVAKVVGLAELSFWIAVAAAAVSIPIYEHI